MALKDKIPPQTISAAVISSGLVGLMISSTLPNKEYFASAIPFCIGVIAAIGNYALAHFDVPTYAELKLLRRLDKVIKHATDGLNNPHIGDETKQALTKKLEEATLAKAALPDASLTKV